MSETLAQGQQIKEVWGPNNDAGQAGARVGLGGVTDIRVGELRGPMGWYDVANVFEGENLERVYPLHMMETIIPAAPEPKPF